MIGVRKGEQKLDLNILYPGKRIRDIERQEGKKSRNILWTLTGFRKEYSAIQNDWKNLRKREDDVRNFRKRVRIYLSGLDYCRKKEFSFVVDVSEIPEEILKWYKGNFGKVRQ